MPKKQGFSDFFHGQLDSQIPCPVCGVHLTLIFHYGTPILAYCKNEHAFRVHRKNNTNVFYFEEISQDEQFLYSIAINWEAVFEPTEDEEVLQDTGDAFEVGETDDTEISDIF